MPPNSKWTVARNLAFYAGTRIAEITGLDVDEVRLSARKRVLRILGKGEKVREIAVHPDLRSALTSCLDERPDWPGADTPALFLNLLRVSSVHESDGHHQMTVKAAADVLRYLGALGGIALSAGALVSLLISMTDNGLFDYTEPTFRSAVVVAIVAEAAAVVLLLAYLAARE